MKLYKSYTRTPLPHDLSMELKLVLRRSVCLSPEQAIKDLLDLRKPIRLFMHSQSGGGGEATTGRGGHEGEEQVEE
eukprot:139747-Hanusia_phi.AAC.1